jgi:hypothetical protein
VLVVSLTKYALQLLMVYGNSTPLEKEKQRNRLTLTNGQKPSRTAFSCHQSIASWCWQESVAAHIITSTTGWIKAVPNRSVGAKLIAQF